MLKLEKGWHDVLHEEIAKPYISDLKKFLEKEMLEKQPVYPPAPLVFHAFAKTPWDKVKVVVVGQDPYHGPGQAHGLSFSVPCGIPQPPSLQNIFKELQKDVGIPAPTEGCLIPWANQGVLLLNAILTVRQGQAGAHAGRGWERFTDAVIAKIAEEKKGIIFLLWGRAAQEKCQKALSTNSKGHLILKAAHPSPLSAYNGFFGCRHFSKTNEELVRSGQTPIDWKIP